MTDAADRPALPDALMPAIVDACRLALEHTGEDGRLMYAPGEFAYLHNNLGDMPRMSIVAPRPGMFYWRVLGQ